MRKIAFILFSIFLSFTTFLSNAQSFRKGNKLIETGIRISVYKVHIEDPNFNTEDDDRAASITVPIQFQYAISDKIGIGAELGIANFFTDKDTNTNAIATAHSADFLLLFDFHYVRSAHVDLSSGLGIGFSSFKYKSNDYKESQFTSGGAAFNISLIKARFYLGDHFGLQAYFSSPNFFYSNGEIKDNFNSGYDYKVTFSGFGVGVGLQYKW